MNDEYIRKSDAIAAVNKMAYPYVYGEYTFLAAAKRHIAAVPSADVQPVKHGRWKPVLYTSHCSCGKSYQTTFYNCSVCDHVAQWQPYGLNYCPNCGARMDGGDKDDS